MKKPKTTKLLGEILVEKGIIQKEQLQKALDHQAEHGGLIGEVLVSLSFATEEAIAQCLAHQFGFAFLPLENYEVAKEVTALIPKNVVSHYCLMPLDKIENSLTVAMANPLNTEAIEDIEDLTTLEIQVFVATSTDIRNAIKKYYGE
jgi:type IV pilus assembly protein PilB